MTCDPLNSLGHYQPYVCVREDGCSLAGAVVQVPTKRDTLTGYWFAADDDMRCTECGSLMERRSGF